MPTKNSTPPATMNGVPQAMPNDARAKPTAVVSGAAVGCGNSTPSVCGAGSEAVEEADSSVTVR